MVGCVNVIFMIAATRINAVFLLIFTGAALGFFLLASSLWAAAEGHASAANLMVVSTNAQRSGTCARSNKILGHWRCMVLYCNGRLVSAPYSDLGHYGYYNQTTGRRFYSVLAKKKDCEESSCSLACSDGRWSFSLWGETRCATMQTMTYNIFDRNPNQSITSL